MDIFTLSALRKSIAHWRRLATGTQKKDEDTSSDYCALCTKFLDENMRCKGCPVAETTGWAMCRGTPYAAAAEEYSAPRDRLGMPQTKEFLEAAQRELRFLESLLPRGKKAVVSKSNRSK